MKIVGYSDRLSVAPSESIRFMVSTVYSTYDSQLVQLIHGDVNTAGPGFKEKTINSAIDGKYPGRVQAIPRGSYVSISDSQAIRNLNSFSLQLWVFATTPGKGTQGLLGRWSALEGSGWALVINSDAQVELWLGNNGEVFRLKTGTPLRKGYWYGIAASYDTENGCTSLVQHPHPLWPLDESNVVVHDNQVLGNVKPAPDGTPLIMAGLWSGTNTHGSRVQNFFNGRLENPRIFASALPLSVIKQLAAGTDPADLGVNPLAARDFAKGISTDTIYDTCQYNLHGEAINLPARAMKSHGFTGMVFNWKHAPGEYAAIHFHDDDLENCGWEADFTLNIPDTMRSGIYAVKLSNGEDEDYLPFFVRPKYRKASSKILFLVPTNSYLAYANFHGFGLDMEYMSGLGINFSYPVQKQDEYMVLNKLLSCYDHHSDGSGTCYSSYLRPMLNFRPKVDFPILSAGKGAPHQFNADLHLVDWLIEQDFEFDVATDEDLEIEGLAMLQQYNVVITGSHHEYWTKIGLDALENYLQDGGRCMYMSGNGLYWVTSFAPGRRHAIEVRRWGGTQSWAAEPGEYHHSTTGEQGGLWRQRGTAPQHYVGVGFTAQGFDYSTHYIRQAGSFSPRANWIFDGVSHNEPIGNFGLVMGGACGFEVDRVDLALGSPPHTLVPASGTGFSDVYQHVVEEINQTDPIQGGTIHPLVKGDMAYFETNNGGAVFSTGSIAYMGSLSHNNYKNNVSRITGNVLRRFAQDGPLLTDRHSTH